MERFVYDLAEIDRAARFCWNQLQQAHVMAFYGEMGAGKTTLIQAMCSQKRVQEVVSSPTFSLINEYSYINDQGQRQLIYHIDLYRLKTIDEAIQAGVEDCLYRPGICLIEWPALIQLLLPHDTVHLYMYMLDSQKRMLKAMPTHEVLLSLSNDP
ncbi:MAG: tRNA (adenosine(37)-N6)-threonylcarbamoyltransferase complex ATPase subunit type 1 TsaE [Thermoflavifilum sp.]|nr:tRNA (adenosine(37)-N6)-threonylcarbamoyltransferase complex ATPase subunit type 1 TsaE [Thermoflavifilum sp.]